VLSHRPIVLTDTINYRTIGFSHNRPNPNYNSSVEKLLNFRGRLQPFHCTVAETYCLDYLGNTFAGWSAYLTTAYVYRKLTHREKTKQSAQKKTTLKVRQCMIVLYCGFLKTVMQSLYLDKTAIGEHFKEN